MGNDPIDQVNGRFQSDSQTQQPDQQHEDQRSTGEVAIDQQSGGDQQAEQANSSQVSAGGMGKTPTPEAGLPTWLVIDLLFQVEPTLVDQVEAHMGLALVVSGGLGNFGTSPVCKIDSMLGDGLFAILGMSGDFLHHAAVFIAGGKIHG